MKRLKAFYFVISGIYALFALSFLAVGAASYLFLSNIQSGMKEQEYRLQVTSEKKEALASLEKRYGELGEDIERINLALPDQKNSSRLLADLDTLTKRSKLKLTMIQSTVSSKKGATVNDPSLLQTVKGNYGYEIPLAIRVEGGFSNFNGFVKKLENYQRLLNVTSIEISKPTDKNSSKGDNIEAKIDLTAYLKK